MCTSSFHPLQCILPPYIADKLEAASQDVQKINELAAERFREKRKALGSMSSKKKGDISSLTNAAGTPGLAKQVVFDAEQLPILPGTQIWQTGDDSLPPDPDAKRVIEGAEKTLAFYKELFNRHSINDKGGIIRQSVHYRENPKKVFDNALWDGEQMIYGDGDGIYTASFTSDLDIIAHELTHGVIDFTARLAYENQSGALNESFADVFGILVKQWSSKTRAKKSDWLIGKEVLKGDQYALRSLKAPGSAYKNHPELGNDPQPAVMSGFKKMDKTKDHGGVHYNSGIPNFAFYVTAYELGGFAWEKAGRVWYQTLTEKGLLKKTALFQDARNATIKKAAELFGINSLEEKAVTLGWKKAEVG